MSAMDIVSVDNPASGLALLDLPDELMEHILLSVQTLSPRDVVAVAATCKRLNWILSRSAAVWKTLFSTCFPEIFHPIEKTIERMAENNGLELHSLWRQFFVKRYKAGKLVLDEIGKMSPLFFHRKDLSNCDMENFLQMVQVFHIQEEFEQNQKLKQGRLFLIDSLQSIASNVHQDNEMTLRFYAQKVLRFVRCDFVSHKWNEFKLKPIEKQAYHEGLVYFSQWFQPFETIHLERVLSDISMIAVDTLKTLNSKFPQHPIFQQTDPAKRSNFAKYLLDHNTILSIDVHPSKFSLQILDALNETMFEEKGFQGNSANYYNPANSYIDQVLSRRQGIPITLCILYSMVASRLGVVCRPVNAPRHFLLQWQNPDATNTGHQFLYIDAYHRGRRITLQEVKAQADNQDEEGIFNLNIATPLEVFQRMTRNLVTCAQIQQQETLNLQTTAFPLLRAALELTKVIGRPDEYPGFGLCQIYLQLNVNHREIMSELDNWIHWPQNLWLAGDNDHLQAQIKSLKSLCVSQMKENDKEQEEQNMKPQSRRSELMNSSQKLNDVMGFFSVGMVMRHKRYNYHCVIFGWDPVCKASKSWIEQMGVDRLSRKDNQPFYNVLVDDGSIRYAADENLEPVKPRRISHPLVGKYFSHFHETFGYEANDQLNFQYPEDFQHLISAKKN